MASFFDPSRPDNYGTGQNWTDTPFVKEYLDPQVPQGVYTGFLASNGFGGQDRRSQWARGLYGQTQNGYQAALRVNPALAYRDYLSQQFGPSGLGDLWNGMSFSQRGEQPSLYQPNTRIIPWG